MPAEHTDKRYEGDLKKLREDILYMGGLVEDQIQKAVNSLVDRDSPLAEMVIQRDHEVNRLDVEIDELCIHLLALHQPTAKDLRFITTGMRINTDLERIADLAVNISQRVLILADLPLLKPLIDIPKLAENAKRMLKTAIDAFVQRNEKLAEEVLRWEKESDELRTLIMNELINDYMVKDGKTAPRAVALLLVARDLERISDHATNIAEDVIYMINAKMVKHHLD